jgi:DNA-binding response OmpR family regulator
VLRLLLSSEGYVLLEASNGEEVLRLLDDTVDLVILDVMMPGLGGFAACAEIRRRSAVPVLFLTAKAQDSDKTLGFSVGGDDYLAKPFSYTELISRVKAMLRRYYVYQGKGQKGLQYQNDMLTAGGIKISLASNQVWVQGREVELTGIEYRILRLLMETPQKIFSTQNIYESVWNELYFYVSNGTVMVHIRKLRVKIEADPQNPRYLKTVLGKGYRFEAALNEEKSYVAE